MSLGSLWLFLHSWGSDCCSWWWLLVNRSSKIFAVDHTIRKVQLPGSFGIRCKNNSSWGWGLGSHFWHRLLLPKKTHKSKKNEDLQDGFTWRNRRSNESKGGGVPSQVSSQQSAQSDRIHHMATSLTENDPEHHQKGEPATVVVHGPQRLVLDIVEGDHA